MFKTIALGLLLSFQAHAYFNMHQKITNNGYKICILGDTGTGSKTQIKIAKFLAKENCNQVRIVGDIIYPSGLKNEFDKEYFKKFYDPFLSVINGKTRPLFHLITGNHDYKQDEHVWTKLHNKFHYLFSPGLNYVETYDQGRICFFNFDTTAAEHFKVRRAYKTYKWLKAQVKGHKSCKVRLAFGHHPFRSSGQHGDANPVTKYFLKNTVLGKVDAYFAGHEHQLSHEGSYKGTELFITGSFSKTRPLVSKPKFGTSKHGYIVMTIDESPEEYSVNLDFKVLKDDMINTEYSYYIVK